MKSVTLHNTQVKINVIFFFDNIDLPGQSMSMCEMYFRKVGLRLEIGIFLAEMYIKHACSFVTNLDIRTCFCPKDTFL